MTYRTSLFRWTGILATVLMGPAAGMADTITMGGVTYEDVLVYKSSTFYYAKLPKEGRVVSVPIDKVDESTVVINDDPFYRDELMALFDKSRLMVESPERGSNRAKPIDPAFQVSGDMKLDDRGGRGTGAGGAGGGGARGLGIARSQAEQMMSQMGMKFQSGPARDGYPTVKASMPDGTTIELVGPPNMLMGVITKTSTTKEQLNQKLRQMQMMTGNADAQAGKQMLDALMSSGHVDMMQGGARIVADLTPNGDKFTLQLHVSAP